MSNSKSSRIGSTKTYFVGGISVVVLGLLVYFVALAFLKEEQTTDNNLVLVHDPNPDLKDQSQNERSLDHLNGFKMIEGDPVEVWNDLQANDQIHNGRVIEVVTTAKARIAQDGLGVLNELYPLLNDSELRGVLFESVIYTAAQQKGYEDLFHEARKMLEDTGLRREFLWRLTRLWTPIDPTGAFAAIAMIEDDYERIEMWKSVCGVWAKSNRLLLEERIHELPDPVAEHAEWMIMLATAIQSPADAVIYLPAVIGTSNEYLLADEIATHWKKIDIEQTLEWALNQQFSDTRIRNKILANVLHEIAKSDPEYAFRIALSEPPDRFGKGIEAFLVEQIAVSDLALAVKLLDQVRAGPSIRHAFLAVGAQFTRKYDFERAVDLGWRIHEDHDQKMYFDFVLLEWASNHPNNLFRTIPGFQRDGYLQSRAAMHLVEVELERYKVLTEAQLQQLREYITKEDYGEMVNRLGQRAQYDQTVWGFVQPTQDPLDPNVSEHLNSLFPYSFKQE